MISTPALAALTPGAFTAPPLPVASSAGTYWSTTMARILAFLFFAVAVACAMPSPASPLPIASDIPSAASGVYLGSDRVCRIVLSRYQSLWVQTDVTCMKFDGALSNVRQTLYAPNQCPNGWSIPFDGQTRSEFFSVRSYDGTDQVLQIVRGTDETAVTNGLGTAEAWYRIGIAASPAPYTCGTPPAPDPHYARLCRQFGMYCGG